MLTLSRRVGESFLITLDESVSPAISLDVLFAAVLIVIRLGEMMGDEVKQALIGIKASGLLATNHMFSYIKLVTYKASEQGA